tara:strand:- start:509 stop:736 length:228 start_codon:yes stop_codon:yes gene_type:complete
MNVVLIIIVVIALVVTWEAYKYSQQKKTINEGNNSNDSIRVNQQGKNPKCCSKVSKAKAQDKRKYKSIKKQTKKS